MFPLPSRYIAAGLISFILYVVAVVIVFQSPPQHEMATAILITCFLCTTFLLMLRAMEPLQSLPTIFCMFYFSFFYLLPGAVQISSNTFQMADVTYNDSVATRAALIVAGFLICFFIGQQLVDKKRYTDAVKAIEASEKFPRVIPIALFCGLAMILGLYCIHRFGFSILLTTRGEFKDNILDKLGLSGSTVGLLLLLPRALCVVSVLLLCYAVSRWRKERPAMNVLIAIPMLAILIPVFSIVNFPPALARNWQFGILLSFLFVFVKGWKPWLRTGLVLGMLVTMFSLFQWLNVLRHYDESGGLGATVEDPISYLKEMDFDGFQTTMNTVIHVRLHDHSYGDQLLASVFFWVPRAVWHNKAESTGQTVAKSLGFDFTNLSTPLPAEFYIDFSFAGVLLGGLLVGYVYRRLDYLCAAAVDYGRMNLHLIMVSIITAFTIFIMRGPMYGVINIFGPTAILGFLVLKGPVLARFFISGSSMRSAPPLQPPMQPSAQPPVRMR